MNSAVVTQAPRPSCCQGVAPAGRKHDRWSPLAQVANVVTPACPQPEQVIILQELSNSICPPDRGHFIGVRIAVDQSLSEQLFSMGQAVQISMTSNLVLVMVHCSIRSKISFNLSRRSGGVA